MIHNSKGSYDSYSFKNLLILKELVGIKFLLCLYSCT